MFTSSFLIIVLDIFLSNESYEATESDDFLQVSVCINKKIGTNNQVPVHLVAETVEMANQSGISLPPTILVDDPYAPRRASMSTNDCPDNLSLFSRFL